MKKRRKELDMTTLLIIIGSVVTTALLLGIPKSSKSKKPWRPKKKNFFVRMGEGDVTYPGYTVHND